MNIEQRSVLRHSLGLKSEKDTEVKRNYYADEPGAKICTELVNKGAMVVGREIAGGLVCYHVTNFGKELAFKPPAWCENPRRYSR